MKKTKLNNSLIFLLFAFMIGACAGLFIWIFLRIMNFGINLLWNTIPNCISLPFYTLIICTVGGIIVGLFRKKIGEYPEDLNVVMEKVKKDGRYSYQNIFPMSIAAMLPLVFGASIGPEAGLTGIIAGLCSWIGDKLKKLGKEFQELTKMGISATLGTIFNSPMFGFVEPIESQEESTVFPKTSKMILYFTSILGAMGIFLILKNLFGGGTGLPSFAAIEINRKEWLYLLPLTLIGVIASIIYVFSEKMVKKVVRPIQNKIVLTGLLAGIILGIIGTVLPLTMFSGEEQMVEVMSQWTEIGTITLLLTGIFKLFLTNICIHMGLKGGHFFPIIFAGICIGYAFSAILGIDATFCVTIITTSLVSSVIRKPLATVLLLMICFPINAIFVMLITAMISNTIKLPKIFEKE